MAGYNVVPPRSAIKIGGIVQVAQKENYENGIITTGLVKAILTSRPDHPRGIKVMLQSGEVGRVQALGSDPIVPVEVLAEATSEPTNPDFHYEPDEDELL